MLKNSSSPHPRRSPRRQGGELRRRRRRRRTRYRRMTASVRPPNACAADANNTSTDGRAEVNPRRVHSHMVAVGPQHQVATRRRDIHACHPHALPVGRPGRGNPCNATETCARRLGWSGLRCSTTATGAGNATAAHQARPRGQRASPLTHRLRPRRTPGSRRRGPCIAGVSLGRWLSEDHSALTPFVRHRRVGCVARAASDATAYDSASGLRERATTRTSNPAPARSSRQRRRPSPREPATDRETEPDAFRR